MTLHLKETIFLESRWPQARVHRGLGLPGILLLWDVLCIWLKEFIRILKRVNYWVTLSSDHVPIHRCFLCCGTALAPRWGGGASMVMVPAELSCDPAPCSTWTKSFPGLQSASPHQKRGDNVSFMGLLCWLNRKVHWKPVAFRDRLA
jgi:hypothetical protein